MYIAVCLHELLFPWAASELRAHDRTSKQQIDGPTFLPQKVGSAICKGQRNQRVCCAMPQEHAHLLHCRLADLHRKSK